MAGPSVAGRAVSAGTSAAKSLYAAASEGTTATASPKRGNSKPAFDLGGDDDDPQPRKTQNRAGRTKQLRSQVGW